jgi:FHA domain-containing protein
MDTTDTTNISTLTVPARSWRLSRGAVIRLREHSTKDRVQVLPVPPKACRIGTASELRLDDPSVSREHAELVPFQVEGVWLWKVHDLKSKNGLRCDGEPSTRFILRPGIELELGELRLIAESEQLIGLVSVLRRFLGLAVDRQECVDQALRSLRDWAAQRAELIVVGEGDLTPVVRRLHNLVIGDDVSFTSYTHTENANDAAAIVKAAARGTLCVTSQRQADAVAVVEHVRETEYVARPQLILCTADATSAATMKKSLERPAVIHVPPLATRSDELEDIFREYAREIVHGEPGAWEPLLMRDLEQLRAQPFRGGLAELEDTALRLVTMRTWGVPVAAAKLGMDQSSLRMWARHRGLETT